MAAEASNEAIQQRMSLIMLNNTFNFEPFEPSTSNFHRWMQRLEGAFDAFQVQDEKKVTYFLHYIGAKAFEIICDKLTPEDPYKQDYVQLRNILEEFYAPAPLEIAENFRFHQRKQQEDESLQEFVVALQKLSVNCKLGDYLKTALRNQFVFGLRSRRIQSRLLEMKDLSFNKAVVIATGMELSERDANQLQATWKQTQINAVTHDKKRSTAKTEGKFQSNYNKRAGTKQSYRGNNRGGYSNTSKPTKPIECFRCGGPHLATSCNLPRDTVCRACGVRGHLKRVCLKEARSVAPTHQLEELRNLAAAEEHQEHRDKFMATLMVNNTSITFEVDSGAAVTIIGKRLYNVKFPNHILLHTNLKLSTYCNTVINVLGFLPVNVKLNNKKFKLDLYVIDSEQQPLLGREWIRVLDLLQFKRVHYLATPVDGKAEVRVLLERYKEITEVKLEKIQGLQARLRLKENVSPIFYKARTVPFKLIPIIEKELDRLEAEGIMERVNSAQWATPIVPVLKKDGSVRICGDFKVTVNPHLIIDDYPLPNADELFSAMAGGTSFSKIDLRQAYLQLEVHPEDRHLLTINTHKGLFQCTRLLFGIASAPAIWQREIENILKGIPGVTVFLDDIKVTGATDKEHLERLEEIFRRFQKLKIKINLEKCEFFKKNVHYCGFIIDSKGIHKDPAKMDAIVKMPKPTNVSELRAFIGMINYYGKFIRNLSEVLRPLNRLLCKGTQYKWSRECEDAFTVAKQKFKEEVCLAHYDPTLPLIVATDASAYGVGAVLSQKQNDGSERVLQFASQALSDTRKKYSQIDKEAYAIVFAIKKFHQYLWGRRFTLLTDHAPLVQIFSEKKSLPLYSAMRMQHYAIFLQGFNYEIKYRNTKLHANADCLSRLPIQSPDDTTDNVVDTFNLEIISELPVTTDLITRETAKDSDLINIVRKLRRGADLKARERFNIDQKEYSLQGNILMRGHRVVVPKVLRKRVLNELHEGHFGVVKTKNLARGYCWWPNIDSDIEYVVGACEKCNMLKNNPRKAEVHCWEEARAPFQRIHADFAGPFLDTYFLVVVDAFSKFPIIKTVKNITAEKTIEVFREIFATFGIPQHLVTDNGTQFRSRLFRVFLNENGVYHKFTAPYNPSSNGQAERFVQILKKSLKAQNATKNNVQEKLQKVLFHYRLTPHTSTGKAPAELMFNRHVRSRLDLLLPTGEYSTPQENQKPRTTRRGTHENKTKTRKLKVGTRVQCRNYTSKVKWKFGTVIKQVGNVHYLIRLDYSNVVWERHINQILQTAQPTSTTSEDEMEDCGPAPVEEAEEQDNGPPREEGPYNERIEAEQSPGTCSAGRPEPPTGRRSVDRPRRQTRPPARFTDYVLNR